MRKMLILLTLVFISSVASKTASASMGDSPLKHPLLKKVRNVLWSKGVSGKISYQVLHSGDPVMLHLAGKQLEQTKVQAAKKQARNIMPEELVRALNHLGV